jgi:hypothetical protein
MIENAILPCIDIHSISWDKKSDFPEYITNELVYSYNKTLWAQGKLSLEEDPPFNHYHAGNAVLFEPNLPLIYAEYNKSANPSRYTPPPPATRFRGIKKIVLLLGRQGTNGCTEVSPTIFGNASSMAKLKDVHRVGNPEHESRFLIGTVNITAGIIRSSEAVYIGNRVISANRTTQIIEPFPWVNDALYLLPEVMRSHSDER